MTPSLEYPDGLARINLDSVESDLESQGIDNVCGVDEAGRGPLAGPVVAAAVIVPHDIALEGVDDSKKLSPIQRDRLFETIVALDLPCAVGIIDHQDIDRMNIRKASLMAMRKAVMDLKRAPGFVLVDGNAAIPRLGFPQLTVVGGDARCRSIGAASIVAKVTRDRIMDRYQGMFPSFSFAKHKGYPTPQHLAELREHGPCDIHRRTFRPVAELIEQYSLF